MRPRNKKKLRQELIEMFKVDQESIYGDIDKHNEIRIKNTERLEQIVKEIGWPFSDVRNADAKTTSFRMWMSISDHPKVHTNHTL